MKESGQFRVRRDSLTSYWKGRVGIRPSAGLGHWWSGEEPLPL